MPCSLRMIDPPSLMLIAFSTPSLPAFVSLCSAVLGDTFDQPLMEMKRLEEWPQSCDAALPLSSLSLQTALPGWPWVLCNVAQVPEGSYLYSLSQKKKTG